MKSQKSSKWRLAAYFHTFADHFEMVDETPAFSVTKYIWADKVNESVKKYYFMSSQFSGVSLLCEVRKLNVAMIYFYFF